MNEWYRISDIEKLDTPALVVYPDRVRKNISTLIKMAGDPSRLRPHVKTFKNREVTKMLLEAGISKFKCATIAEAEMLASCGAKDVLLAYQPIGPKIDRFLELIKLFPSCSFSCLADNWSSAAAIDKRAAVERVEVRLYIDLNVGMNRTGIAPGEAAIKLYHSCHTLKNCIPIGLHAYDGHIRQMNFQERKKACDEAFETVLNMQQEIIRMGMKSPEIIAGGSPTFSIHALRKNVTCSPGTFVYWDAGYSALCPEQDFIPAALVISRIISYPDKGIICTDLGHKSVAAESEIQKRVVFLNGPPLKAVGQSEEHLILETRDNEFHTPGEILYGLPWHICPTCALYERAYTVENGIVTGEWMNVARDRKISI
ncbi:MAG TPA: D-TA family PLP-dependent enzyme [Flavitalea sp.]|nr:D-TA family PLP-dependent enzyme [Flavitalea sp.]